MYNDHLQHVTHQNTFLKNDSKEKLLEKREEEKESGEKETSKRKRSSKFKPSSDWLVISIARAKLAIT